MGKDDNLKRTALLCLALDYFDGINGRTKLQKILYLTSVYAWNAINDYSFYQYGPYSEWVSRELETLVGNDIIKEKTSEVNNYTLYSYILTDTGKSFLSSILHLVTDNKTIAKCKSIFDKLSKYDSKDLEIMASLVFLKNTNIAQSTYDLVRMVRFYKKQFSETEIRNRLIVFDILGKSGPSQSC